ncbi:MAG: T9SS type A sorting domain-containing protein, partial [Bacteroidales bacterium]|nr:T9SS type A sorting domain-containing protein [Bacteroidales bacterium]
VTFEVSATDGNDTWISYFSIIAHAPILEYIDYSIADPSGNNNGKLDPGETVDVTINVKNSGTSDAYNATGGITAGDPYVTINTNQATFGDIAAGSTESGTFSITAAPNTPAGHMVTFTFDIEADLGITATADFDIVVGQIPVLILDLDDNNNSGPVMEEKVQALGVSAEYVTSFPADLNLYSSVFVCLGIYANNHVLSSGEGQILADFMNSGGCVYMEGGDTWYYDTQTAAHAMFNINGTDDGTSDMGTVLGQTGTFTEGMSFNYTGENSWMDHIDPISPAEMILKNQSPSYGTGVAYDPGSYKTIGTSHEFGGLADGTSPSTKEELMEEYLIFFGIIPDGITAGFTSNTAEVCEGGEIEYFDSSFGNIVSWDWTFEGGTPATSTEQDPVVTYNSAGTYDVTLIVSDGTNTNEITATDYVTVNALPNVTQEPFEDVCVYDPAFELTGGLPAGGTYTGTAVTNNWFDPDVAGLGTHTITYTYSDNNGCENFVEEDIVVTACTGIEDLEENIPVLIFPNPNKGSFNIKLNLAEKVDFYIFNSLNELVYTEKGIDATGYNGEINLAHLSKGIYYLKITGNKTSLFKKIIIQK